MHFSWDTIHIYIYIHLFEHLNMELYITFSTLCFYPKSDSKILGGLSVKIASISVYECQDSLYSRLRTGPSSNGWKCHSQFRFFSFILVCFKYSSWNFSSTTAGWELLLESTQLWRCLTFISFREKIPKWVIMASARKLFYGALFGYYQTDYLCCLFVHEFSDLTSLHLITWTKE